MAEIFLTGIPSAELFGGISNQAREFSLGPILSEEAFGDLRATKTLALTGIASDEAFGGISHFSTALPLTGILTGETFGNLTGSVGFMPPDISITRAVEQAAVSERLSSPVIDQNITPVDAFAIDSYDDALYNIFQDFYLPPDYQRGNDTPKIPPLTGLQVLTNVATGYEDVAALDWVLRYLDPIEGWTDLESGTTIGVIESGTQVWFTIYFPESVAISEELLSARFRFGLRGRAYTEVVKEEIPDTRPFIIDNAEYDVYVPPGTSSHLDVGGVPSVLHRDSATDKVYYSQEYGVAAVWYSNPNPLAIVDTEACAPSGDIAGGDPVSLNFRVLAGIADEGTDFLGNNYRNVVTSKSVDSVDPINGDTEGYWLSKPNPSQFATESLYFNISKDNDLTTVDHILLDPVTPGIYFNVYYSSDGDAVSTKTDWENKLWTPVSSIFRAQQRLTHPLPVPITAKYIKIEFTQLQPRWYAPGDFQKEILYDKFPKWVLDYYLLALDAGTVSPDTEDPYIARTLSLTTNALLLAYTYYLDDLRDEPQTPRELIQNPDNFNTFLAQRGSQSDQVDPQTLARIKTAFQPFTSQPGLSGATDSLLNLYTGASGGFIQTGDITMRPTYPVEQVFNFSKNVNPFVSTLERDPLLVERSMPVMKFFVEARHRYRTVKAVLENDKAYFAGVKEIAFLRDDYSTPFDRNMLVEVTGDSANVEVNDFAHSDAGLVVSND